MTSPSAAEVKLSPPEACNGGLGDQTLPSGGGKSRSQFKRQRRTSSSNLSLAKQAAQATSAAAAAAASAAASVCTATSSGSVQSAVGTGSDAVVSTGPAHGTANGNGGSPVTLPQAAFVPHPMHQAAAAIPCDPAAQAAMFLNQHAAAAQAAVAGYAAMAAAAQHIAAQQQHQQQAQVQAHQHMTMNVAQAQQHAHAQPAFFVGPQQNQIQQHQQQHPGASPASTSNRNVSTSSSTASAATTDCAASAGSGTSSTNTPQQPKPQSPPQTAMMPHAQPTSAPMAAGGFIQHHPAPGPQHVASMAHAHAMAAMAGNSCPALAFMPPGMAVAASPGVMQHANGCAPPSAVVQAPRPVRSNGGKKAKKPRPHNVQKWNLEQLESHVRFLQENNQPVPPPLAKLLADARHREQKKAAKRIANRKSASTSRARKKALVEEMAQTNARLRRQALILALLPDLVMAISLDGTITFCSAQVERVLRHKCDDLVGANIEDLLAPASREAVRRLVEKLVEADSGNSSSSKSGSSSGGGSAARKAADGSGGGSSGAGGGSSGTNNNGGGGNGSAGDLSSSATAGTVAAVISDQSQSDKPFPLSVVNVTSKRHRGAEKEGAAEQAVSAGGTSGRPAEEEKAQSSSVNTSLSRSASSFGSRSGSNNPSSSDDSGVDAGSNEKNSARKAAQEPAAAQEKKKQKTKEGADGERLKGSSSSDESYSCVRARDALNRNVQSLNEKIRMERKVRMEKASRAGVHTDDVTGATVTANNAEARLSSLQHKPKMEEPATKAIKKSIISGRSSSSLTFDSLMKHSASCAYSGSLSSGAAKKPGVDGDNDAGRDTDGDNENSSEDSGYREGSDSFPSREDSASSVDDSSNNGGKYERRPRPLAPACNVCLIRDDLTTIWCEVTSSIRTRSVFEQTGESETTTADQSSSESTNKPSGSSGASASSLSGSKESTEATKELKDGDADPSSPPKEEVKSSDVDDLPTPKKVKELLLCLRPLRDGKEKVAEELRFQPSKKSMKDMVVLSDQTLAKNSSSANESSESRTSSDSKPTVTVENALARKGPPKKRQISGNAQEIAEDATVKKKHKAAPEVSQSSQGQTESTSSTSAAESERSVVESLMLMSNR